MLRIFISYRRADTEGRYLAHMLFRDLRARYGETSAFLDVDSRSPGLSFPVKVQNALNQSSAVLVVIGSDWLNQLKSRERDERDWVRFEVAESLKRENLPVVPVCQASARLPTAKELPVELRELASRDGIFLDPFQDFDAHLSRLLQDLERVIAEQRAGRKVAPAVESAPADGPPSAPTPQLTMGLTRTSASVAHKRSSGPDTARKIAATNASLGSHGPTGYRESGETAQTTPLGASGSPRPSGIVQGSNQKSRNIVLMAIAGVLSLLIVWQFFRTPTVSPQVVRLAAPSVPLPESIAPKNGDPSCTQIGGNLVCPETRQSQNLPKKQKEVASNCVNIGGNVVCPDKDSRTDCVQIGGNLVCPEPRHSQNLPQKRQETASNCMNIGGNVVCPDRDSRTDCVQIGGNTVCPEK